MIENNILKTSDIKLNTEPYIFETSINGLYLIKRPRFFDDRGSFQENFRTPDVEEALGHEVKIMQNQVSGSGPNVLRGIHAEDQVKLITPTSGRIFMAIVDLRLASSTFKNFVLMEIDNSDENAQLTTVCLDKGLANSFYVYSDSEVVEYFYSVTGIYDPENAERGVKFDDSSLAIPWPNMTPELSKRDRQMPSLEKFVEKYLNG